MQFKATLLALLSSSAALAVPLDARAPAPNYSGFVAVAARSGSPIHLQPIVARAQGLFVGGQTATYCPLADCSGFTNSTVLACGKKDGSATSCSPQVSVPGGQQLYVNVQNGAVNYTQAHSAYVPPGALRTGFHYTPEKEQGRVGSFSFSSGAVQGFYACPVKGKQGSWRVVVPVKGVSTQGCLGMSIVTSGSNATAWQYT